MSKLKYNQKSDTINMQLEETQAEEMENIDEPKKYQWIKGDNFGDTVTVKSEDTEFIYFTNGEQIYKNLVREFLQEIINNELPLPGFNEGISLKPVQPRQILQEQAIVKEVKSKQEETPLEKLILKLSQKNVESINVKLGINIPKKDVVEMLIENSDESRDELLAAITKMAVAQITIDKLQEFIKEEINSYLNNYYNE
jgi:hypothetical protein